MELLERAHLFSVQAHQRESVSIWHRLPVARRALVLVLLFLGQCGELRVVLTKRLSQLRSFPGHISLPGGKADTGLELPWMVARREMSEEIGISEHDRELIAQHGFSVDKVAELPCYLSRTFSAVRPCVGFLNTNPGNGSTELLANRNLDLDPLASLTLKLNPGESSSVFLVPLRDFLYPAKISKNDEISKNGTAQKQGQDLDLDLDLEALERTSRRVRWGGIPWNLRSYTFPVINPREAPWLHGYGDLSASESETDTESAGEIGNGKPPKKDLSSWGNLGSRRHSVTNEKIYDVWGLTANILHDLAEIIYSPLLLLLLLLLLSSTHQYGEEQLIWSVWHHGGQMRGRERLEIESRLISSRSPGDASFGDVLPRTEFNRLKRLYSA